MGKGFPVAGALVSGGEDGAARLKAVSRVGQEGNYAAVYSNCLGRSKVTWCPEDRGRWESYRERTILRCFGDSPELGGRLGLIRCEFQSCGPKMQGGKFSVANICGLRSA